MDDDAKNPLGFLPKITTRGDIGAAGLGLAIGFFVDSALHPFGIQPGAASLYSAAAAVGIKNSIQAWRESRIKPVQFVVAVRNQKEALEHAANRILARLATVVQTMAGEARLEGNKRSAQNMIVDVREHLDWWSADLIEDHEFRSLLKQWMTWTSNLENVPIIPKAEGGSGAGRPGLQGD